MAKQLSILIPARNEMFLAKTIENIFENIEGDTEVIAVLDGEWANPPVVDHENLTLIYNPVSIGQRAATNQAARISNAKYVMKVDAHCAFDKGFDVKMIAEMHDDWTMVPVMYNLHAFDWVCACGHRTYQGPTPDKCEKCGKKMEREIIWQPKQSPRSTSYCFDNTLHFQYFKAFQKRPEGRGDITDTMSIQGSCFMLTREKYWELDISSEQFASWGQQGVEVACKTWLSGGRVVCNQKTWYAHMFRTQGGDFGFPYSNPGSSIEKNRKLSRELFMGNKWDKAIHPFSWLLEKFAPVPGWEASKGIVYYTDNELSEKILKTCQEHIKNGSNHMRIVSVSLKPLDFGENIHLPLTRGYLTMAKQILAGLREIKTDIVFFCEHDVLYHPSHFDFIPPRKDVFYYNTNVWIVRYIDGHAVRTKDCRKLSNICAYRDLLIKHYEKRVDLLEKAFNSMDEHEFNKYVREMGFEPGTHSRSARVDDFKSDIWEAKYPNLDIRDHGTNLTPTKWCKDKYRNPRYAEGWQEADEVKGWGKLKEVLG